MFASATVGRLWEGPLNRTSTVLCIAIYLLPSATKLRRLCFYTCLSVHGGVCLSACWNTIPPEQTPHPGADTPLQEKTPHRWLLLRMVRILLEKHSCFNGGWFSMEGTVHLRSYCIGCNSYASAAAGRLWEGLLMAGSAVLCVPLCLFQRQFAFYWRDYSWEVPESCMYLFACFRYCWSSIERTFHDSLCLFQRSVLNATDAQKVHGHGHDIIVYRPPTFKHPRPPDVNTVNPP